MNLNRLKYFDRYFKYRIEKPVLNDFQSQKLRELKDSGYCVLENCLERSLLEEMQKNIDERLRSHEYELPCLGQSLINEKNPLHVRMKNNYFLSSLDEKRSAQLTFEKDDVKNKSYEEVLIEYQPSTLKLYIPEDDPRYTQIWFNEEILQIVESYMGIRPFCGEAYIRRNFPCKYKVMNHFWHRDKNHPHFLLKMFILFSDCSIDHGPHQYVENSHHDNHEDILYYTEDEIKKYCEEKKRKVVSSLFKAGTIILEDTRGLHRADTPRCGFRDLGFAVFVPMTFWSRKKNSFYSLGSNQTHNLTQYQKSFIPHAGILQ